MIPSTNDEVISLFRANGGEVPAPYPDPPPMLILHSVGRRSGREHLTPMRCMVADDGWYVFGSAHGRDRDPDWVLNLRSNPAGLIELGTEVIPVQATELPGAERDAIFARQVERFPYFGELQERLERTIPVMHLTRRW